MTLSTFDREETQKRRNALVKRIRSDHPNGKGTGLVVIPTFMENQGSYSTERFRPESYFLYFCGLREPSAVLVIDIEENHFETLLFLRPKDTLMEKWDGARLGVEAAPETLGVDLAYPMDAFKAVLNERLDKHQQIYHALGVQPQLDTTVIELMQEQRSKMRQGITPVELLRDFRHHADHLRLVKSPWEIERMRHACKESAEVMTDVISRVRAGVGEHEIMGFLLGEYLRRGLSAPSYTPIVGSHQNACVLHYIDNNAIMPDHALTLIDAAGEYFGYCADITRTIPTAKTFTKAQRTVYEIVYAAHQAAIEKVREGCTFDEYHIEAVRVITEGLIGLGWIKEDYDTAIEQGLYKPFFMHRTGHFLGLDTHDVGAYREDGAWSTLKAGMIMTVEPGIYISPSADVPEAYHHIGIRLEDDMLVTNGAPENLTRDAPILAQDIERLK